MIGSRALIVGAAIILIAGAAYWRGHSDCQNRHNRKLLEAIEDSQEAEEERQRVELELVEATEQLKTAARNDPVVVNRCISPGRVKRLNEIR